MFLCSYLHPVLTNLAFILPFALEFSYEPSWSPDTSTSLPEHQSGPFLSLKVVSLKDLLAFLISCFLKWWFPQDVIHHFPEKTSLAILSLWAVFCYFPSLLSLGCCRALFNSSYTQDYYYHSQPARPAGQHFT